MAASKALEAGLGGREEAPPRELGVGKEDLCSLSTLGSLTCPTYLEGNDMPLFFPLCLSRTSPPHVRSALWGKAVVSHH
jgi:hypothetical protein